MRPFLHRNLQGMAFLATWKSVPCSSSAGARRPGWTLDQAAGSLRWSPLVSPRGGGGSREVANPGTLDADQGRRPRLRRRRERRTSAWVLVSPTCCGRSNGTTRPRKYRGRKQYLVPGILVLRPDLWRPGSTPTRAGDLETALGLGPSHLVPGWSARRAHMPTRPVSSVPSTRKLSGPCTSTRWTDWPWRGWRCTKSRTSPGPGTSRGTTWFTGPTTLTTASVLGCGEVYPRVRSSNTRDFRTSRRIRGGVERPAPPGRGARSSGGRRC